MGRRSWTVPMADGSEASVSVSVASTARARYEVAFPFLVGGDASDGVLVTGGGTVEDHRVSSQSGRPVSDLVVSVPADVELARLVAPHGAERVVVHLADEALLDHCARAIAGDGDAAEAVIDRFASPVRIPLVCGSFLGLDDTLDLVRAVADRDRYVRSMLHSYRYAVVRSALVSRTGFCVRTYRELLTLVKGLDGLEALGEVGLVDALADVIATVHDTPEETEALFESLGADLERLFDRDDGRFAACFLAHIARTAGVEAALAYELPRKLPPRGHYDRRKRAVFGAPYGHRGPAWRRLLDAARRESAAEVGEVLAHTLYWTGEESRSDSRLAELLLDGAERVASHTGQRRIEHRARFERHLAAGHRLRGTHCWGPSAAHFAAARELAADRPYLPEWEPVLAEGLVRSRGRSLDGDHAGAVAVLDRTLEAYLAADPPTSVANESVRHLRAQKCEIASLRHRGEDPARARALLEEARTHYAAIGFDRSREKVERQLAALPGAPSAVPPAVTAAESDADAPPEAEADPPEPADLGDDWLERLEYPDEDAAAEAYDERFEDPYPF